MRCWICASTADSREHLLKASDLRYFFGDISPESPVYYHSPERRNQPLKSAKANRVKTGKVICSRCNDTRTAPHDHAWESLLSVMSDNWREIKTRGRLKLQKHFPGSVRSLSKNVHLYFTKLFGCRIIDEDIPIPIREFREAIINEIPHSNLFLTFCFRNVLSKDAHYAGISEVHAKQSGARVDVASWYYTLGELDVQISWFRETPVRNIPGAWHPADGGKILKFRRR